jgi:hypothetical protein
MFRQMRGSGCQQGADRPAGGTGPELGLDRCTLNSTETARKFYLSLGYQEQIAPANEACRPMAKALI